ncbi:type II secretion system protein GspD [Shewanella xiamenensis]|uniref:Type II/III secretion system secretin-like domain-containing protein n=3 Tax=Shewanella xiamenensis TaxID=332186 RepID=A0ABT6UFP1_9GAMM|nr:hypothetical protein [Shewanella xiamenensis]MDI5833288.1 hypothetical protein [Shewanella xiamenensis]
MNLIKKISVCIVMASAVILSGCKTPTYQNVDSANKALSDRISDLDKANGFQYVKKSSKWYVPKVKQSRLNMPDWCFSPQQVGAFSSTPIEYIVKALTENLHIRIEYGPQVDRQMLLSIPSNRDVCDGLDKVSLASGYSYEINDAKITFKALEDRVVDVAFAPGVSKYYLGNDKDSGKSKTSSSGTTQNLVNVQSDTINEASSYKGTEAELNPWGDLISALNQMKSKDGNIFPNFVAANILLRDTPERVEAMERYITKLNRAVNRVISLEVEFIELTTNAGDENSFNLQNIVKSINNGKGSISFTSDFTSSLFPDQTSTLLDIAYTKPAVGESESALIRALKKHGKVTVGKRQRVVTLNNQIAKMKDVVNDTYLAQSKKDSTANVGATDELIPGSVDSGLGLYALAREFEGKIQIHLTANMSNLMSIGEVTSGTAKIQTPSVSQREFDTMALIPANTTLLLSGMANNRNETQYSGTVDDSTWLSPLTDLFGYSRASKNQRTETIMLVTAGLMYKES